MPEISITFKEGPAYDAPWVVVKASSVDEAYETIQELRAKHVFDGVKATAKEFQRATPAPAPSHDQAIKTVQAAMPGSQVIQDQQLPDSLTPKCEECNEPAQFKEGVSGKGTPYSGYYCRQWHKVK